MKIAYDDDHAPPKSRAKIGSARDILEKMPVGKSYLFKNLTIATVRSIATRHGGKEIFQVRSSPEGARVWRLKEGWLAKRNNND